jgi:hypothetical protein
MLRSSTNRTSSSVASLLHEQYPFTIFCQYLNRHHLMMHKPTYLSSKQNTRNERAWNSLGLGQEPNDAYQTCRPGGIERFQNRTGSSHLHDMIHSFPTRDAQNLFVPFGRLGIVDEMSSPEFFCNFELLIRRRSRDHCSSECRGDLQNASASRIPSNHIFNVDFKLT